MSARQALAERITNLTHWRNVHAEATASAERGRGALVKATATHASAEAAVALAREQAVASVTRPGGSQPSALRSLRQAEADAADDVAIAREALVVAEAAVIAAEAEVRHAEKLVGHAADDVIYASIEPHRDALIALARTKFTAVSVFEFLMRCGPNDDDRRRNAVLVSYHNLTATIDDADRLQAEAVAPWEAARRALLTDAAAPLPDHGAQP